MRIFKPMGLMILLALAQPALAAAPSYGFRVAVTLSPKAAALLQAKHEGIVVSAMYTGEPTPAKMNQAEEDGTISLGTEDVTIPGAPGIAVITGKTVIVAHLSWVKAFDVLINVYSARRSSPDNLLDCGIFQDTVAKAQAQPIPIACKLIGEP
jgi:hypothetical protein